MFAEILIEYSAKKIDNYFTYLVPKKYKNTIKSGMKVQIPFGNNIINGFVMHITNKYNAEYEKNSKYSR